MNLSPAQTAQALPYPALAEAIAQVLRDPSLNVPARQVLALPGGAKLLVMPAVASGVAMTKLITFVSDNPARGLPAIQGDVVVFDAHSGERRFVLDGPTVTARRTAAVSLLAAQLTAARQQGPMLIVGAGVQGRSHLEAFHQGLGVNEFLIASRSQASAQALVDHALALGVRARVVSEPNRVVADCPWVVTATSAQDISMTAMPGAGSFISAVGAFTPQMAEWSAPVCQALSEQGRLLVDSRDADFEAGDLLQAGIDVSAAPALADLIKDPTSWHGSELAGRSVFFHNCGWAGWDLAAALCVMQQGAHRTI